MGMASRGIDHQVHDDLFELGGIGLHRLQGLVEKDDQVDVFADEPAQHRLQVGDHRIEVGHPGLQQLLAAEGQELAGQGGGPLRRFPDSFQVAEDGIFLPERHHDDLIVAHDGSQYIVEVMGHSARQPSYHLHSLGLQQLLFQHDAFVDVYKETQNRLPPLVLDGSNGFQHPASLPAFGDELEFAGGRSLPFKHLDDLRSQRLFIFLGHIS